MFLGGKNRKYHALVRGVFGIRARNIELYKLALMHRSASIELDDGTVLNNERLEFLGDAVLETVVSEFLFVEFPRATEGQLTQLRSKIVSRQTLDALSARIGLPQHIIHHSGGSSVQKHIDGDALEAMIGAMYLDRGYNRTNKALITRLFRNYLDIDELINSETDHKSRLLEWCQKSRQSLRFATDRDEGFTPRRPLFRARVIVEGIEVGHGVGDTKKQAEQNASQIVFAALSDDEFLEKFDAATSLGELG